MRERKDPHEKEKEEKGLPKRTTKGGGILGSFFEKTKQFFEDDNIKNS
jgi:hypothetical protein